MKDKGYYCIGKLLEMFIVAPLLVMLIWNAIIPDLVGLESIGFLRALGLYWLCRKLFTSDTVTVLNDYSGR